MSLPDAPLNELAATEYTIDLDAFDVNANIQRLAFIPDTNTVMSLPDSPSNEPAATEYTFDLYAYIGRYAPGSETRIQRLAFIAEHTTDESITQSALNLLESQLKNSGNTVRYQQFFAQKDQDWLNETTVANEAALEVLEARLSAAQANLNKDAIRTAYLNIGDFLLQKGHVRDALRNVQRARDYCTSQHQTLCICWKVIELAMNTSNYSQVRDYVSKAEHSVIQGDRMFPLKLKVATGMALLGEGHYKEAAEKFAEAGTPPLDISALSNPEKFADMAIPPPDISALCSPEDVALFSSLLCLATLPREQLAVYLEQQATFLEIVPPVRDALRHYLRAEYKACLDALPCLELDMVLAKHAPVLLQDIRNRSYVDYLRPYRRVHLTHMAQLFDQTTDQVKKSLALLIGSGKVAHARIDCRTETLEKKKGDVSSKKTQERIQRLQESVLNNAYASIVRLACLEHEASRGRAAAYASPDVLDNSSGDEDDDMSMAFRNFANPEDDMP